jgi:hypothetical protein
MVSTNEPRVPGSGLGSGETYDIEEHWHVHLLASPQPLLLKAEALDFVEVWARLHRGHVVRGHARNGLLYVS